jgi:hypothetical protein
VRILLRGLSWYLLLVAFALTGIWFLRTRKIEAVASLLVLIATVTLTFVDRWAVRRERRRELLRGLVHELYMNLKVLDGPEFKVTTAAATPTVYPRLYVGALEAVIASGAFTEARDRALSILLHGWLQRAHELNDRLLVTETRTFINPTPVEVLSWQAALTGGAVLRITRTSLTDLAAHLVDHYASESGIDRDTVLFSRPAATQVESPGE